jgi:hypothetical protein
VNGTAATKDDEDDDFDLFGSDDEEDEAAREELKQKRAEESAPKKKKPLIAKSNIILNVKPWDDETDMGEVEKLVRTIEADGLLWGACLFHRKLTLLYSSVSRALPQPSSTMPCAGITTFLPILPRNRKLFQGYRSQWSSMGVL